MDDIDRKILNILQDDFPLTVHPYKDIAEMIGLTEAEVLNRIQVLKDTGIIRRIGGVINARGMGWTTTLCAMTVPEHRIDEVAQRINQERGVTHNYLRDHQLNMWFTLIAPSPEEASLILQQIERDTSIHIVEFPALQSYKIKVSFDMGEGMVYDE